MANKNYSGVSMSLKIYNSLTREKEPFVPLVQGRVTMYVCGVTVYDYCHIGHARAGIVFDVIYRYMQFIGYQVVYVRNFTDVDDKIIKKANEEGKSCEEISNKYIKAFYEDMNALGIDSPTHEPKATEHIQEMIHMIQRLIEKGHAYPAGGDVNYSVESFQEYGKLSGRKIDELYSGARVEIDEKKKNPLDFALWKESKPGEPAWESPWGMGRPGWHIECSAMSQKYLGDTFDIHGGGKDLIFPHHENEIAQSHGSSGKKPIKYWVHNGFVDINKQKMSKSLGNFFTIREVFKKYQPETIRLFLLSSHYRNPIEFSDQNLNEAGIVLNRFYEFLNSANKISSGNSFQPDMKIMEKFSAAMDDDFNTALALGYLNEYLRSLNAIKDELEKNKGQNAEKLKNKIASGKAAILKIGKVLGLFLDDPLKFLESFKEKRIVEIGLTKKQIEEMINARAEARKNKDWETGDKIREQLGAKGILLDDSPSGTTWRVKP